MSCVEGNGEWKIVESKSGVPSLMREEGGRQIWVHSPNNPLAEAARFTLQYADPQNPSKLALVLGVGLGYHLAALNHLPPRYRFGHILAAEPGGSPVPGMEPIPFWGKNGSSVTVVNDLLRLRGELMTRLHAQFPRVEIIEHPVLRELRPGAFAEWREVIRETLQMVLGNMNTLLFWQDAWTLNTLTNLSHVVRSVPVGSLFGRWKGRPAVVVAAGPSLTKQLPLLRAARDRMLVVAVGTAIKALEAAAIEPDLVVSVDGGEPNFRHFEGVACSAPLVYDPMVYPGILDVYRGRLVVSQIGNPVMTWLAARGLNVGQLAGGGSVAHLGLELAAKMDAHPVILIGQDLAYTDGRTHALGTAFSVTVDSSKESVQAPGYYGGWVPTSAILNNYRIWFEYYIKANPSLLIINATEGGACIEGALQMPFADAVESYCKEPQPVKEVLDDALASSLEVPDLSSILKQTRAEIVFVRKALARAVRECRALLKRAESGLGLPGDLHRRLMRLSQLDRSILACTDAGLLLADGAYRAWLLAAGKNVGMELQDATPERQAAIWRRSLAVYTDLDRAAERVLKGLEAGLQRLRGVGLQDGAAGTGSDGAVTPGARTAGAGRR